MGAKNVARRRNKAELAFVYTTEESNSLLLQQIRNFYHMWYHFYILFKNTLTQQNRMFK